MIDAVADTVGEIPSRSKYGWLRGSLTRAIVVSTPYCSRASWQMIDVVLVVAGDRDHDVRRPLDPGALEHEELGRVALVHLVLELRLEAGRTRSRCSISVTSWPARISVRARFEPTFPPPAIRRYI